jgi:hypothetical protein
MYRFRVIFCAFVFTSFAVAIAEADAPPSGKYVSVSEAGAPPSGK